MESTTPIQPKIEASWLQMLQPQFQSPYFAQLKEFLVKERQQYVCYPSGRDIFNAFNSTPFDRVKVVILGQDPYHEPGQAHGLSFSVQAGTPPPPSLVNIITELNNDMGYHLTTEHGDLSEWAQQGVLLLNATLTVRAHQAGSHQKHGWEQFTDAVISTLNQHRQGLVFLLWGRYAMDKRALINEQVHHILTAPHPSPLSAYRGFFGCRHFSRTNDILRSQGQEPIDWSRIR